MPQSAGTLLLATDIVIARVYELASKVKIGNGLTTFGNSMSISTIQGINTNDNDEDDASDINYSTENAFTKESLLGTIVNEDEYKHNRDINTLTSNKDQNNYYGPIANSNNSDNKQLRNENNDDKNSISASTANNTATEEEPVLTVDHPENNADNILIPDPDIAGTYNAPTHGTTEDIVNNQIENGVPDAAVSQTSNEADLNPV